MKVENIKELGTSPSPISKTKEIVFTQKNLLLGLNVLPDLKALYCYRIKRWLAIIW